MSMPRVRSWNLALAAAGAVALIVEGQVRAKGGLSPGDYVLAVAAAVPLAWGTRAPLLALAGVAAGAILCDAAFDAGWAATGLVAVQLFTVALLGDRQRSLIVGALTAIVVIAAIVAIDGSFDAGSVAIRVPLVFLTLAVGDTVRSRRALRAAARERAEREALEREEEGRRRAAEERLRIARELHDTLAHSLVAINVRAGVALDLDDSQDSSAALEDVKQASATALRDLRATLGLLRDRGEVAPTAPAFDLVQLLIEIFIGRSLDAPCDAAEKTGFFDLLLDRGRLGVSLGRRLGGGSSRSVRRWEKLIIPTSFAFAQHVRNDRPQQCQGDVQHDDDHGPQIAEEQQDHQTGQGGAQGPLDPHALDGAIDDRRHADQRSEREDDLHP